MELKSSDALGISAHDAFAALVFDRKLFYLLSSFLDCFDKRVSSVGVRSLFWHTCIVYQQGRTSTVDRSTAELPRNMVLFV